MSTSACAPCCVRFRLAARCTQRHVLPPLAHRSKKSSTALDEAVRALAAELRRADFASPRAKARRDGLGQRVDQAASTGCAVGAAALRELLPALRGSQERAAAALMSMVMMTYRAFAALIKHVLF